MEPLDDAIRLRALGLGAGMVDVLERQIELVFVVLGLPQYSVPRSVRTRQSLTPLAS